MADEEGVPEDRCGFVLEPGDVGGWIAVDYEADSKRWYEENGVACCRRGVWDTEDTDQCVWHADVDEKPVEELVEARAGDSERLDGAYLRENDLDDAISFENCTMLGADFGGADLVEVDLGSTDLVGADLRGADLRLANLERADLRLADLERADLREADLGEANLRLVDLGGADLRRADLGGANLRWADLGDTNLRWADLGDANLRWADLKDANLRWADFGDANLRLTDLGGANLGWADLGGADLREADLEGADLREADLGEANLRDATFIGADLTDADLTDANLRDADLEAATLEDAVFTRTDLRGANLENAELYQTLFSDIQMNNRTDFGDICYYEAENERPQNDDTVSPLEAAAWTYRRIQTLHEENALAQDARQFHVRKAEAYRQLRWREMKEAWGEARENATLDTAREKATAIASRIRDRYVRRLLSDGYSRLKNGILLHVRAATYSVNRWLSRHGESPHRVIGVSLGVIGLSTLVYPIFGIRSTEFAPPRKLAYFPSLLADAPDPITDLTTVLGKSLYFSVVTFTTVGYGDLQPVGFAQLLATVESFAGALLMALLVFVLGRRATW